MRKHYLIYSYKVILTALIIAAISWTMVLASEKPALSKITFYVTWYDVGKAALEGLKGIKKVERGFKGSREINTVFYDPSLIGPEKMIDALKAAGTFQGVVEEK